ncbi:MAG: hypothetical protein IMW98_01950 [Firmicutes bacterium]|nr:hypothetical protein [Bacillota bacterium]
MGNNLPATMLGLLGIGAAHVPPDLREGLVLANVLGNDIGPKLTPIGSLATLLWLGILERRGYRVTGKEYLAMGLLLTPPVLAAALAALAVLR